MHFLNQRTTFFETDNKTNKWRVMRNDVISSEKNALRYFEVCCCLHNFFRTEKDQRYFNASADIDDEDEFIRANSDENALGQVEWMRDEIDNNSVIASTRSHRLICDYVNGIGVIYCQYNLLWSLFLSRKNLLIWCK